MERDFLNITRGGVEEEAKGCRRDSGLSGQRPFTKKTPSLQQFIPQKAAQEDRSNDCGFRSLSSLTFKPMKVTNHPNSLALAHQKSFSLHDHPPQITTGHFSASSRRTTGTDSVPVASPYSDWNNNPFFKLHDAQIATSTAFTSLNMLEIHSGGVSLGNSIVNMNIGTLAPRNMPVLQTTTAQLTIFYAGAVRVYDSVSSDKAEAIMALASEGSSNLKGTLNASRSELAPFAVTAQASTKFPPSEGSSTKHILCPTPLRVASHCSSFSNPISVTSIAGAYSSSGFGTQSDAIGGAIIGSLAPSVKQESSITLPLVFGSTSAAPRAVPQARKASLARFLEKRKERVNEVLPYSTSKKLESANALRIYLSHDINLSRNQVDPIVFGNCKNSTNNGDSPSTKLEM